MRRTTSGAMRCLLATVCKKNVLIGMVWELGRYQSPRPTDRLLWLLVPVITVHSRAGNDVSLFQMNPLKECNEDIT